MKRVFVHSVFIGLYIFMVTSCVSTKVTSMKDPSHNGVQFKSILVISSHSHADIMQAFEDSMVKELRESGISAVANHVVLPPLREYSDDEKRATYRKNNIDGYIIISPKGVNTATVYVPTYSKTSANVSGGKNSVTGESSTVTYQGGERQVTTGANTQAKLFNIDNGNPVWQGDAKTNINNKFAGITDIINSFCSNIVERLQEDGMIQNVQKWKR